MPRPIESEEVRAALQALANQDPWLQSPRLMQFLAFVVEETLAGRGDRLKETVIGAGVFGRPADYDPKVDPIVRVEARRLRLKLLEYYEGVGSKDPIRFELRKGSYRPEFVAVEPEALAVAAPESIPAAPQASRRWRWSGSVLAIFVAAVVWFGLSRNASPPGGRGSGPPPRLLTDQTGYARTPAFSPDGRSIAYSHEGSDFESHIFIIPVAGGAARALTEGAVADYFPAWSPDGRTIAFLRRGTDGTHQLMVVGTGSDPSGPRSVGTIADVKPIEWMPDGRAILVSDSASPAEPLCLISMAVETGQKSPVSALSGCRAPLGGDTQPRVSPDGTQVAFRRARGESTELVILRFDRPAEPRVVLAAPGPIGGLAWHSDGRFLLATLARASEGSALWKVPLAGGELIRVVDAGLNPLTPVASFAGQRLAYVQRVADTNVWRARLLADGTASNPSPITRSVALDTSPQFSPDGRQVAWRSGRSGFDEIWVADADGNHARQLTQLRAATTGSPRWSPNGQSIVFESRRDGNAEIYRIAIYGPASPVRLTSDPAPDSVPSWSHDGKTIYFASKRTGDWQVWRMDPTGANPRIVTRRGGFAPFETADGRTLVYSVSPDRGGLRRVPVTGGQEMDWIPAPTANLWGQWALTRQGVIFARYDDPAHRGYFRLDGSGGPARPVLPLTRLPVQWDSGLAISADEQWIAWSQLDHAGSDIYILDGFH